MMNKIWPILLAIYIISPFDAHPMFIDDLIASGALFYFVYKNAKRKKQYEQYYSNYSQSGSSSDSGNNTFNDSQGPLTLDKAYGLLGVDRRASLDELNRAYKLKVAKSHPDKVSHLSKELQDRAQELTLMLNEAYQLIKRSKN